MPTLKDYLNKNISAVAAKSALGVKLRAICQGALLPALGATDLDALTPEAIVAFGEQRLKEPKKDGSTRSLASVEQEMAALEDIVKHFHGGKGPAAKAAAAAVAAASGNTKSAAPTTGPGGKPKITRAANRGR